jgi:NADH dehydrogenase
MAVRAQANDSDRSSPHEVVVIGAGYAGVIAANRILSSRSLAERQTVRVTVVNPRTDFVQRIRLHEVMAGTAETASFPLTDILHEDVELIAGTAIQIDPDARLVDVEQDGAIHPVSYDMLVYAVGSQSAVAVPGVREHALPLGGSDEADRARRTIAGLSAGSRVTVVGGGATGVEAVTELAERRPDLTLTLLTRGTVMANLSNTGQRNVRQVLDRLGITVIQDSPVLSVEAGQLVLADGRRLAFDACIWTVGFTVPDLARRSGLATDGIGRLRLDATLTSIDSPHILGAGDAVALPDAVGAHLRMCCATAVPLGGHAADMVLATFRGTKLKPVSVGYGGQCISLGRRYGLLQLLHADDTPRPIIIPGRAGAWVKERICRYSVTMMRNERRRPGAWLGVGGPRREPTPEPEYAR